MSLYSMTLVACLLLAIVVHGQDVTVDDLDDALKDYFKSLDTNGDGSITVEEYFETVKAQGHAISKEAIQYLIFEFDYNDDNFNQFKESGGWHEDAGIAIQLVLGRGWRETEFLDQKMAHVLHSRSGRNMRKWNYRARRCRTKQKQKQRLSATSYGILAAFRKWNYRARRCRTKQKQKQRLSATSYGILAAFRKWNYRARRCRTKQKQKQRLSATSYGILAAFRKWNYRARRCRTKQKQKQRLSATSYGILAAFRWKQQEIVTM